MKRLLKHAPTAVVAAAVAALAFADGGYALTTRAIFAIALWWAVILGLGFGLLPIRPLPRAAYVSGGLLAGLGVVTGVSLAWSASPESSFLELDRLTLYLGLFVVVVLTSARSNLNSWVNGLAIAVSLIGLLALTSRLFPGLVPGSEDVTSIANARARLAFPFGYWNALGMLLAIGLPLLLRSAVLARATAVRGLAVGVIPALSVAIFLTSSRGAVGTGFVGVMAFVVLGRPRIASAWAAICAGAGSVLTIALVSGRRALVDAPFENTTATAAQGRVFALILLAVCVGAGVAYIGGMRGARTRTPIRTPRLGLAGRLALGGLVVVALLAVVVAANPARSLDAFKQAGFGEKGRQGTTGHLLSANGGGRYQFWSAAIDQFEASPVLGGGAGTYELWWAANPRFPYFVADAHSLWLETLGELGVAGLALLVGAFGYGLLTAIRRLRDRDGPERLTLAALSGAVLAWAFAAAIDWMWEMTVVTAIAVVCLALMTGPATSHTITQAEDSRPRARRGSRSFGVGVAVIAAAWLVICAQASPLLSEMRIEDSRAAAARGDFDAALRAGKGARTLQPWAASPYRQLATVEEQQGRLGPARGYIREAIERQPGNFELWRIAARIETNAGDELGARKSLERSRRLNPRVSAATVTP